MPDITTTRLRNGLHLAIEPIPAVASVAVNWLLPVGAISDAEGRYGISTMLGELIFRGAGGLDSRTYSDTLDRLGAQRTSHVSTTHLILEFTQLGRRFDEVLPHIVNLVHQPMLPNDAVEPIRQLCLQSFAALEDDPQHLAMLRLRERHLPPPFNRHGYGEPEALEAITDAELRAAWPKRAVPDGSILTVAGAIDPEHVIDRVSELLGDWQGASESIEETGEPMRGYRHITHETAQVHIGVAWDAPAEPHADSMLERVGVAVLSGSTSGRLFTEVRQKRSLCYSVGASYRAGRRHGHVGLYAGTTPERAQETLDVSVAEVRRLLEGVEREEFERAVIGLKSNLIMQGESTPARAGALAADLYRLERGRTLDELSDAIDAITLDELNAYLRRRSIEEMTVVAIGPQPLDPPRDLVRGEAVGV